MSRQSAALVRQRGQIRPKFNKLLHTLQHAIHCGIMKHSIAVLVLRMNICTGIQELLDDAPVLLHNVNNPSVLSGRTGSMSCASEDCMRNDGMVRDNRTRMEKL